MKSEQIVLASRPHGLPSSGNFRFEEKDLNNISEGRYSVLAANLGMTII